MAYMALGFQHWTYIFSGTFLLYFVLENCLILRFIVVLSMNLGVENPAELVEESIQHAKEAITLDVKDGNSWCKFSNKLLPWHI